jgi:NADH dehydrogenase FAD-containing subunit
MNETKTQILIIGAGYGGMMAALRLAGKTRRMSVELTLINTLDTFVERLRLHEMATHRPEAQPSIVTLLRGTGVKFLQGTVAAIDAQGQTVTVQTPSGEQSVSYTYLIYALGSAIDQDSIPGVREYAYVLNSTGARSVEKLRATLPQLAQGHGHVVVCGGGPTGIEAAAQIKGVYPDLRVSLVTANVCGAFAQPAIQTYMREAIARRGVAIKDHATVKAVTEHTIGLADGQSMPFDLCLWAGGFRAGALAAEMGLALSKDGRIHVDPCLRTTSHPNIYVVGDAAYPVEPDGTPAYIGAPPRMSALYALITGAHVADNLYRLLQHKSQKPLGFSTWGQAIALGPDDAVGFATFPNDHPVGPIYHGKLAYNIRAFFVWFLKLSLELERRWPGFFFWMGKGRYSKRHAVAPLNTKVQQTS